MPCKFFHVQKWGKYVSIYSIWTIGICPLTYITTTLHIHVPVHRSFSYCTNRPHMNSQVIQRYDKIQLSFTLPLKYTCQQQVCFSNTTHMPHLQITWHASMGACQYICHIRTFFDQWGGQKCYVQTTVATQLDGIGSIWSYKPKIQY